LLDKGKGDKGKKKKEMERRKWENTPEIIYAYGLEW